MGLRRNAGRAHQLIHVVIPFYQDFEVAKPGLNSMHEAGLEFDVSAHQGPLIFKARNRGINGGLSQKRVQQPTEGFTHFLFVDADIAFDASHVRALMNLKAPIAACPYLCHDRPDLYQSGQLDILGRIVSKDAATTTGRHAHPYVGAGFLLVHRSVFQHLPYPWFHHRMVESYDNREQTGEDVGFCLSAREAGIPILIDFDHPVEHQLRTSEQFDFKV